jgi:cysteine synthase A
MTKHNIDNLIGNTPIIKIKAQYKENIVNIYAKLEYYNYTGSIKDRLALYIIKDAKKNGILKEGMPIIEATSGNTGISFASIGAYYNHPVHIFIPDTASIERIKIMELYGAKVYLVSKKDGGFKEAINKADKLAKEINGFRPDQFNNIKNIETHYNTTGLEIINEIDKINSFVSGIGTGGTLMGIAKRIKEKNKNAKIIALEPSQLPIITKGITNGKHRIEGIGDDFIPSIVDKNIIDKIITINDEDAINMSRILAKNYGLGIGISSGANLLASIVTANNNDNVVTIFPDDFKKYLSTDLTKEINKNSNLISNQIKIISIEEYN